MTVAAAAQKFVSEAKTSSLSVCIVRPGGIFGPGDRMVLDRYIIGKDNVVLGEGSATIDFLNVDSVAFGALSRRRAHATLIRPPGRAHLRVQASGSQHRSRR